MSTPEMEDQLRDAAWKGKEAALTALLDAKIVNIEAGDPSKSYVSGCVCGV